MSTEPHDATPDLILPDGLPCDVKLAAKDFYQRKLNEGTSDHINLLNRWASDKRIETVYERLNHISARLFNSKHYDSPGQFYSNRLAQAKREKAVELRRKGGDYNEATARLIESEAARPVEAPSEAADWSGQACAIYCFFYSAFYYAYDAKQNKRTLRDLEPRGYDYSRVADQFDFLFDTLLSWGMTDYAKDLNKISRLVAKDLEDWKDWTRRDFDDSGLKVIKRQKSPKDLQYFTVQLGFITHVVFRRPLNDLLAIIANVVLSPKPAATETRIRQMRRDFPFSGMGGEDDIPLY
jgi:hypothetical protein